MHTTMTTTGWGPASKWESSSHDEGNKFGAVFYPLRMLKQKAFTQDPDNLYTSFPPTGIVSFGDGLLTNYGSGRTALQALNPKQALWVGKAVETSLIALMNSYDRMLAAARGARAHHKDPKAAAATAAARISSRGSTFWDALYDIPIAARNVCYKTAAPQASYRCFNPTTKDMLPNLATVIRDNAAVRANPRLVHYADAIFSLTGVKPVTVAATSYGNIDVTDLKQRIPVCSGKGVGGTCSEENNGLVIEKSFTGRNLVLESELVDYAEQNGAKTTPLFRARDLTDNAVKSAALLRENSDESAAEEAVLLERVVAMRSGADRLRRHLSQRSLRA